MQTLVSHNSDIILLTAYCSQPEGVSKTAKIAIMLFKNNIKTKQ
jgi:hypothetical protein